MMTETRVHPETGATPPSDAAVGLIELLMRHPEEVETLRAMRR